MTFRADKARQASYMKSFIKLLAIVTIIGSLTLSPAFASQTDCPEHFADG